jgi:anthranilate synthase component 1
MVNKTKEHIREGDIFQAVISNRLSADFDGSLLQSYRVLRTTNPSPYMFYLNFGDLEIAGASPETLVTLKNKELVNYALAGTCKRGKNISEDESLTAALLKDEKERAEHNMLVDLARNDLGKISEFGSVKVAEYMKIVKFSHVSHIASTIISKMKNDFDQLDALGAVLPAGTLSGAPKKRACQIIDYLEKNKRGIYGGAIGYIDFSGNMDTCISIRMAVLKNGKVFVQAGAGIVADSNPEKEFEECSQKARAMISAIETACREEK